MKNTIKLIIACFIAVCTLVSCAYDGEIHTELASLYPESSLKGWQLDENNTGLRGDYSKLTVLDPYSVGTITNNTLYITSPNITISDKRIEYTIIVDAPGVTIRNCLIIPTAGGSAGVPFVQVDNATIIDTDVDCSLIDINAFGACITVSGQNCIIESCNISGGGTGISIQNTSDTMVSVAEGNYIHGLRSIAGVSHNDGLTIRISTGIGVIVRNNCLRVDPADPAQATGPLFIQAQGHIDNVLVEGNLLQGYGYATALDYNTGGYGYNMRAVNNRFDPWNGTNWSAAISGGPGWHIWEDNFLYNKKAVNYRGAVIPDP